MNNPIRVYYNPDFIASCITALFDDPFWDEDNDGKVRELSEDNSGIGLHEINEEPLHYGEEDGEIHQIEWLGLTSVDISVYEDEFSGHLSDYYVKYESLPSQIIEELVEILLNH